MRSGYRLIKRIGAGSYGNVYLVVDPATGVEWALKVERPSNNVASVKAVVKPRNGDGGGGGGGVLANAKDGERSGGGGGSGTKRKTGVAVEALLEARIILELQHPNVVHTRSVQFDDVNPSMIASVSELGQLTLREYLACDHRDDMETEFGGFRASRRTRASSDRAHRPSSIPPRPPGKSRRHRRQRRRSRPRHRETEWRRRGDGGGGGGDADFFDDDDDDDRQDEEGEEEDEESFVAVPLALTVFWERLAMMRGLVAGMHYFHGKNVAHFDLKPDNILLFARLVYAAGAVLMRIAATRDDVGDRDKKPPRSAPTTKRAGSSDGKSAAEATKRDDAVAVAATVAVAAAATVGKKAKTTTEEDEDTAAKARWKGPEWDAKHADFGLAELVTGLTPDQPIGGTSSHRAPEILRPLSNTRAWPFAKDYWSMLVVIWSALFCCHPFVSGDEFSRISDELHVLALVFARLGRPSDVWIRMNVDADAQRELAAAERVAKLRRERRDERRRAKAVREKAAAAAATATAEKRASGPRAKPVATRSRSTAPASRTEAKKKGADAATKRRGSDRDDDDDDDGVGKKGGAATAIGTNGRRTREVDRRAGDVRKKKAENETTTTAAADDDDDDDTSSSDDDDDEDDETLPTSTFGAADPRSSDGAAGQMRVIVALLEMRTGVSYNTWCAAYGTPVMHALMRMFAFGFVYAADTRVLDFEPVWHASGLPERPPPPPTRDAERQDPDGDGSSSSNSSSSNSGGGTHRGKDDGSAASSRPKSALDEKRGATATLAVSDAKNASTPPPPLLPPLTSGRPAPRYPTFAPLDDSKLASWFESEKRRLPAPIAKSIWEIWTVLTLLGRAKSKPIVSYASSAIDAKSRSPDRSNPSSRPKRGSASVTTGDAVKGDESSSSPATTVESDGKVPSPTTSEYCAILSLATKLAGFKDDLKFFGRMRERPARTLESMYARQNEIIAALFTVRFSESWVVADAVAAAAAAKRRDQASTIVTTPAATHGMWPVDASVASHQVATMSAKLSASSRGSVPSKAGVADTDGAPKKSTDRTATTTTTTLKLKNSRAAEDGAHRGATKTSTVATSGRGARSAASTTDAETKDANRVGTKEADRKGAAPKSAAVREPRRDVPFPESRRRGATGSAKTRSDGKGRIADSRDVRAAADDDNGEEEREEDEKEEGERDREFGETRLEYRSRTVEVTDNDEPEDDWHARVVRAGRR